MNDPLPPVLDLAMRARRALAIYGYASDFATTMTPDELETFAAAVDEHGHVVDAGASYSTFKAAWCQYHEGRKAVADPPPPPDSAPDGGE